MAADPSYPAIRVYRAVGFTEGGTHLEATLAPGADVVIRRAWVAVAAACLLRSPPAAGRTRRRRP